MHLQKNRLKRRTPQVSNIYYFLVENCTCHAEDFPNPQNLVENRNVINVTRLMFLNIHQPNLWHNYN